MSRVANRELTRFINILERNVNFIALHFNVYWVGLSNYLQYFILPLGFCYACSRENVNLMEYN